MKNFVYLTLISLLLFAGLSCGEKEKVKPEKLPEMSEQLPELPDYTKEPWDKSDPWTIQVPLRGEDVEVKVMVFSNRVKEEEIRLFHDKEGKPWLIYRFLLLEKKSYLYENEGEGWLPVAEMTEWSVLIGRKFMNERYGFNFPTEGLK